MIRLATKKDLPVLVEFNIALALESEGLVLKRNTVEKGVQSVLDEPLKGQYYVIEKEAEVVGQLLITYEWSDWRNANWWWIQSVYTKPTHRKQGIFSSLFYFIEATAQKRSDVCGIRLAVDRHNFNAQKTYQRLNMNESHYYLYEYFKVKDN